MNAVPAESRDLGLSYKGCRRRISNLVRSTSPEQLRATVATCPAWSVHDLIAHIVGVVDDALAGRLDGVATERWTEAQVVRRRCATASELLSEWDTSSSEFEERLDHVGPSGRQAVMDVVTHEHDLRLALDHPGARESEAVGIGVAFLVPILLAAARRRGIALQIRSSDITWGESDPGLVWQSSNFELLRAMTGRRSVAQIQAMMWEGDCAAVLDCFTFGPFTPPEDAVLE